MTPDAVLLCVYPLVLLGAAMGLRTFGRLNTSPWASRVLAGHRRATGRPAERARDDDWPHSEVPRLYAAFALVAAAAATVLSLAGLLLHHHGSAWIAPAAVFAASLVALVSMGGSMAGVLPDRRAGRVRRTPTPYVAEQAAPPSNSTTSPAIAP
jgi:hypothetical protein